MYLKIIRKYTYHWCKINQKSTSKMYLENLLRKTTYCCLRFKVKNGA